VTEYFRYAAFISYSSKDARFAKRLHKALESYGVPAVLGEFDLIGEGRKNRIYPVFRDREELSAGDLNTRLLSALNLSGSLIVICSPNAAASPWVANEIDYFVGLGRKDRIFAIIASDAPLTDAEGNDLTRNSFPAPFLGDVLTDPNALEPLAADARPGKDGFRKAFLKIVGGLVGVTPGQIIDRDTARRRRNAGLVAAGFVTLAIIAGLGVGTYQTMSWRSRMTATAESLAAAGQPFEALGYAIAGTPPQGAVISARAGRADSVLRQLGDIPIVAAPGGVSMWQMSADGQALVTVGADGQGLLRRFGSPEAPVTLGMLMNIKMSADGAWLVVHNMEGKVVVHDLSGALAPRLVAQGMMFPVFNLLSDQRTLALMDTEHNASLIRLAPDGETISLGKTAAMTVSDNGARILLRDEQGVMSVIHAATPGISKPLDIADLSDIHGIPYMSPNGRIALFRHADSTATAFDIDTARRVPLPQVGDLHPFEGVYASDDGAWLVTQTTRGEGRLFNLEKAGEVTPLGSLQSLKFSAATGRLVAIDRAGAATLYDLSRPTPPGPIGVLDDVLLSENGQTLVTLGRDRRAYAYRFDQPGPALELGEVAAQLLFKLSPDGRYIVTRKHDDTGELIDIARGGARTPLGRIWDADFQGGGAILGVLDTKGQWTVLAPSLTMDLDNATGHSLREQICVTSADALTPLAASDHPKHDKALTGRLHNPCDWRGLASVEGAGQWLKRLQIGIFGTQDFSCEAARASGASNIARQNACERPQAGGMFFGAPPEEPEQTTDGPPGAMIAPPEGFEAP